MKKYLQWGFISFISFLAMGCCLIPEKVQLDPTTYDKGVENIGHGRVVALQVVDGRTRKDIGNRPSGFGPMASISLDNDPVKAVYTAVSTGLTARGFVPVDYQSHRNEPASLTLTLHELQYEQKTAIMIFSISIYSSIDASVKHNSEHYQRVYHAGQSKNYPVIPMTVIDEDNINEVLSDNINKIFFDKKLMSALAK